MKLVIRWRPLALFSIVLVAFVLRLYGLNWDQGNSFHPDERQILFHVTTLSWPTSLAQFLDPAKSPLNPHFFAYGSFPLYLLAVIGNIYLHFFPSSNSFVQLTLVGRVLSALFDTGTVLLTGLLGLLLVKDATPGRRYAWNVALLAAALVAFTPLQLQLSHFYAVDTMLLFFVMLTILACVVLVNTEKPIRWGLITGLAFALALATKFSAAPLALPIVVAAALRWYRRDLLSSLLTLVSAGLATIVIFIVTQPYALLDMHNFIQQVSEQGDLARGLLDLPYVRQFAGTTPFVYEAQNIVLWGMGLGLGIAAGAGIIWLVWHLWQHRDPDTLSWLIVLSWLLLYGAIICSFYVKFMRYMLPVYPFLALIAAAALATFARYRWKWEVPEQKQWLRNLASAVRFGALVLVLGGTIFQGLALLNVYSQPNTRIQASRWLYQHVKPGSVLTYEQWDDPLPVAVDGHDPSQYVQAGYLDINQQPQTGLDLYGDDTTIKAQQLAHMLTTANVITMATDRLDKSIPRLPFRYPLTIHYYQLLFSGQLGYQLKQTFTNRPNLFGITLDDSSADESYSVFDHPTVRIFVREEPYPYTADQLAEKLLSGVQLPPPGAQLSGAQRALMLSPQQISDDQQSPPLSVQFPADNLPNQVPLFFWWLTLILLGLLVYPLTFTPFRALSDHGYIFSKIIGVLLLAYIAWMLSAVHLLAFSHLSVVLVLFALLFLGCITCFLQRRSIIAFVRQHWRLLLFEEVMFTAALLLFVGIRAFNPDLWHIYRGGEKPMELAFLNAVLRSPYMPPLDPWFSGGYINYYYYGYVVFAALIKLTSIVPTTAFNLAIPTLFAMTFSGVVVIVYNFSKRTSVALLGGYFAVLIGNFDALTQFKAQLLALLSHIPPPAFDFWQSSRIIPFTINEFPFWSFLFADLHPHVIDMPITVLMLGIIATFLLSTHAKDTPAQEYRREQRGLYLLTAFILGTIACINPWDVPLYALLLLAALIIQRFQERRQETKTALLVALGLRVALVAFLGVLAYLFYLPFYSQYQQLYVNGVGLVKQGTGLSDFLTIFGLWIFLALSLFLADLYRRNLANRNISVASAQGKILSDTIPVPLYIALCVIAVIGLMLLGVKMLLGALLVLGVFLFIQALLGRPGSVKEYNRMTLSSTASVDQQDISRLVPSKIYMYLLLIAGLCVSLGMEVVYVRDFLDGGDWERMNTVFKFSIQAWFCFAIGGALAVQYLWRVLSDSVRHVWFVALAVLVLCSSLFLTEGTLARVNDHQLWANAIQPVQCANYTPTLDGFAFVGAWYPGDALAIEWLNEHVAGSPVILEAAVPYSYQWYNRISVFTGLPDVLGWSDHVGEQRYSDQPANRMVDISLIYTSPDANQALELLHYYHVRYIYVGDLERQAYAQQSATGLAKFDRMVGDTLRIAYRASGVTIYEVL